MSKKDVQLGDYVEVVLLKKSYKGILLEPPSLEKGIILLKLDTGYNLGFSKKDVLNINILKREKKKDELVKLKKNSDKPSVAMIITGGTIVSSYDSKTGGVTPLSSPEKLFRFYPEMFDKINLLRVEVPFMKLSENMGFRDWQKISRVAEKLLNEPNINGLIVVHGTDTLHYTSAALSFFLGTLNKPVVLTYSQKSTDRASSDANLNLQCSALCAVSDIAEVMVVGHASINDDFCYAMPGTKTRKMHTSRRDAFKVINDKPFAKVYPNRIEILSEYRTRNKSKVKLDAKFENKVALVKVYPGQNPEILEYYAKKKYKGIVLEMFGIGHVPLKDSGNSWLNKLREIQKKGVVVCASSQTIYGRVEPFVYSTGREILNTGVIYLDDMLAETALVKLGWVLGHKEWAKSREKIKEKMLENVSGEFNECLGNESGYL